MKLKAGDRLLLVTDGVTEAEDATGEFFGSERLESCCQEGLAAVEQAVTAFRADTPPDRRFHHHRNDLSRRGWLSP